MTERSMRVAISLERGALTGRTGTGRFLRSLIGELCARTNGEIALSVVGHQEDLEAVGTLPWRPPHRKIRRDAGGGKWTPRVRSVLGTESVRDLAGPHDVYLNGWHWPMGKADRPFVAIVHDVEPLLTKAGGLRGGANRLLFRQSLALAMKRAAHVVCVSQTTAQELIANVPEASDVPISTIHHGLERREGDREAHRGSAGEQSKAGERRLVLAIGQHVRRKNYVALTRAFCREVAVVEPNVDLVIIGGENEDTAAIRECASAFGCTNRIQLAGSVSDEARQEFLRRASVFVCSSLHEGFGIPILEAMESGVPVACSTGGALSEVGGDAVEYFDPRSESDMAGRMLAILQRPMLSASMREKGLARVAEFTAGEMAEKYLAVFRAVAAER